MRCPFCRTDNDRVMDSRNSEDGATIRRRRECLSCLRRFTTYERVEENPIRIVKKDGTRIPFDRQKIKTGLVKACWKRPISDEQIEAVVTAIEADIHDLDKTEIETQEVGELVMQHLRKLDHVAYVRFASVYREFQDIHEFVREIEPIISENKKKKPSK